MLSAGTEFCDVTTEVLFMGLEEVGVRLSPAVSDSNFAQIWSGLGWKRC